MQDKQGPAPMVAQRVGERLFRHRSYTLVPLAVLVVAAVWFDARASVLSGWAHWLVCGVAIVLLVLGEVIRFFVAGRALPGTSGRGATLRAATLITSGAYAWTRNPLYLANGLLWLGASLLTLNLWVAAVVLAVISLQYHFIVLAEERFLIEQFGQAYVEYCRAVPRFFPFMGVKGTVPFSQGKNRDRPLPFDWAKAVFREHDTIYLIFLVVWLVLLRRIGFGTPIFWYAVLAAATLVWLATKWIKKTRRRSALFCRSGCA